MTDEEIYQLTSDFIEELIETVNEIVRKLSEIFSQIAEKIKELLFEITTKIPTERPKYAFVRETGKPYSPAIKVKYRARSNCK